MIIAAWIVAVWLLSLTLVALLLDSRTRVAHPRPPASATRTRSEEEAA